MLYFVGPEAAGIRKPLRTQDLSSGCFEFGNFRLDRVSCSLYRNSTFIPVTPKALETLSVLVEAEGRLVTKDQLMARVWPDAFVEDGNIANNISILRKILNPHFDSSPIETVARRGYRFTAPVVVRASQSQPPRVSLMTESGTLTPEAEEAIREYLRTHNLASASEWASNSPVAMIPVWLRRLFDLTVALVVSLAFWRRA